MRRDQFAGKLIFNPTASHIEGGIGDTACRWKCLINEEKLCYALAGFPGKRIVTCDDDKAHLLNWLERLVVPVDSTDQNSIDILGYFNLGQAAHFVTMRDSLQSEGR